MRLNNKKKTDYAAISRRSIKKDFYSEQIHMEKKTGPEKRNSNEIRISKINPACQYAKFSRFFVGKLVRLAEKAGTGDSTTGWYEFIRDEDRKAINDAAGWSDNKRQYFLENPKLK
jgi:hypothetical protein